MANEPGVRVTTDPVHNVRALTTNDLSSAARVHLLAFPDSALTLLGAEAVRRYYSWQLLGPHDVVALCITENEELTAFCIGGTFVGALQGFLRKNQRYLCWRLVTHPWLLIRGPVSNQIGTAVRSLVKSLRAKKRSVVQIHQGTRATFGILAIAVEPSKMGTGQGKCLMNCLEHSARLRHYSGMHLTVSPDNSRAIDFYERLGWSRYPGSDGRWMGAMKKNLSLELLESGHYPRPANTNRSRAVSTTTTTTSE
ncbi:MAG: GNAT family N-acetyltransferase [Gemmatimonadaceae bacterium]